MAAYVIYQAEVSDPERYEEYKTKAAACIVAAGGKYIVRGGEVDVLEGEAPAGRTVVLEFATMKAAHIGIEARSTARSAKSAKGQRGSVVRRRWNRLTGPPESPDGRSARPMRNGGSALRPDHGLIPGGLGWAGGGVRGRVFGDTVQPRWRVPG